MNPRILLVEDEPSLILTLSDMLKSEGYDVESAENGILAKTRIERESFDLVILDVMLPGMSGFEVCKTVRDQGFTLPILMLTARGQTSRECRSWRRAHGRATGSR